MAEETLALLEQEGNFCPEVEHIQDTVETVLMDNGYAEVAKSYI
jgi:hypothetical protein